MIPVLKGKSSTENLTGTLALTFANAAGVLHMVILPFWVDALMRTFKLDTGTAGLLATLYILGMLTSSLYVGSRFNAIKPPLWAVSGFLFALLMFLLMMEDRSIPLLNGLHFLAGIGAGVAQSCTLGTLGRASNPHALFAKANIGFKLITLTAMSVTPILVDVYGANGLFTVMAVMMLIAFLSSALAFPVAPLRNATPGAVAVDKTNILLAFAAVGLITTSHAVAWSFAQSAAVFHAFAPHSVKMAFIATGVIAIAVPIAAGLLEGKWPAPWVSAMSGLFYGSLSVVLLNAPGFPFYAFAAVGMLCSMLFAQIFVFGLIARLDISGKSSATLPAIQMASAAVGPFLGGMVIRQFGYPGLGVASLALCVASAALFITLARRMAAARAGAAAVVTPMAKRVSEPQSGRAQAVHLGTPQADLPK